MDYKQAYEKFTANAKKSQDIKVGDKVRYRGLSEWDLTQGGVYEVVRVGFDLIDVLDDEGDFSSFWRSDCEPVTDTSKAPTLWRDMTDAEKGALLLAHHEGKVIEYYGSADRKWLSADDGGPYWMPTNSYRIKPEPKVEVVEAYAQAALGGGFEVSSFADYWDWRITFNTIDGEPDPASIKMERMRD